MSEKVIGVFPMFNTGEICVHTIDEAEERVLASINGKDPEWCKMSEWPQSENGGDQRETGVGLFVRLLFRAVLSGHACVNPVRRSLHENNC